MAHELLEAPLPSWVRQHVDAISGMRNLRERVLRTLFDAQPVSMNPLQTLNLDMALYDGSRHRLRHLVRVVFAPSMKEYSLGLPRWLGALNYPLRLIRLAWKFVIPASAAKEVQGRGAKSS